MMLINRAIKALRRYNRMEKLFLGEFFSEKMQFYFRWKALRKSLQTSSLLHFLPLLPFSQKQIYITVDSIKLSLKLVRFK